MLKLNKNQVKVGQKIDFENITHLTSWTLISEEERLDIIERRANNKKNRTNYQLDLRHSFKAGDTVEIIQKVSGTSLRLKFDNGKDSFEFGLYWSEFKKFTTLGSHPNLGIDSIEYVIFYKGEKWKPKKFKDLGKVKASLMSAMNYSGKVWDISQKHFSDRTPEVTYGGAPEWIGSYENCSRSDFANFEIFEWGNRKIGKKVDFDAVAYYDSLNDFIRVTAQFGSAVRQQYKTYKDESEFKYILCFVHEDYRTQQYPDYDYLKESPTIKNALKDSGVKGTKKCTKAGKTAICFKTSGEMIRVVKDLPTDSYYVLDMQGRELEEQSAEFVISENRANQIDTILELFA